MNLGGVTVCWGKIMNDVSLLPDGVTAQDCGFPSDDPMFLSGYKRGYEDGHDEGYDEGYAEAMAFRARTTQGRRQ
jgi:hypothetical protein